MYYLPKKHLFVLFLLLFIFHINAYGQTCLPGGITFTTQQQIDDFVTDYPGCTEILGSLNIQEATPGEIINLNGLSPITSIGISLGVSNNSDLSSLGGLSGLSSVGLHLNITNNDDLTNLQGLDNLSSVNGKLNISFNDNINSIAELSSLLSINGFLSIRLNPLLNSLVGLDNIDPLTINQVAGADIIISGNSQLTTCDVLSVCDALNLPTTIALIEFNATGCNSQAEVETACASLPVVWIDRPYVYAKNGNNILEWKVVSQINNEKFEVEYRQENGLFVKLGELQGHGTTLLEHKYSFTHKSPPGGLHYYRIKQQDFDGNYSYSEVVSLRTGSTNELILYPNPISDSPLTIDAKYNTPYTLFSMTTEQLKTGNLHPGENQIDLSSFSLGIYYLQTAVGVKKIVKI